MLFESPVFLVPCLVVLQLVLIRVWSNRRTAGSKRAVLIGFAMFPLLLGLQTLVVTDRERITAVVQEIVDAAQRGDVPRIAAHVSESFEADGLDHDAFLEAVKVVLTRYHVENARVRGLTITASGLTAEASFRVICRIVTPEAAFPNPQNVWIVTFEWHDDRWQITNVELSPTPMSPFTRLRDLMH